MGSRLRTNYNQYCCPSAAGKARHSKSRWARQAGSSEGSPWKCTYGHAPAAERNARLEDVNLDDNPLDADIVERVRDATDRTPEERARAAAAARSGMGDAERAREEVDERDPASLDRYFKLNPPPRVPELWAKPLIPEGDEEGGGEGQGAAFPGPWKAGFNAPEKKLEEELVERRKGEL